MSENTRPMTTDELIAEIKNLKTVMMAAAVEITDHWDAHCDDEGYGPVNLVRRLENGYPAQYGYDAQSFVRMERERDELRAEVERLKAVLHRAAEALVDYGAGNGCDTLQELYAELASGAAHTDHPMRHWDRTCHACQAAPAAREPLTDEQIAEVFAQVWTSAPTFNSTYFARAIEAAHGITQRDGV